MAGFYKKVTVIRCIDCGGKRKVHGPNYGQVKRCKACQYDRKRVYNSKYVKRKRKEARRDAHIHAQNAGIGVERGKN